MTTDHDLIGDIAERIRDLMIEEDVRFATRDPARATAEECERVIDHMARDIATWFLTLIGANDASNQQALEESDRDRGEVIKRAMVALEQYGVPNNVGDPDEMNSLAARIQWLAGNAPEIKRLRARLPSSERAELAVALAGNRRVEDLPSDQCLVADYEQRAQRGK